MSYFLTFKEDYSRFCYIYLIKNKCKAANKLRDFVSFTFNNFAKKPKIISFYRGKTYVNKEVTIFMEREGIQIQCRVAERKNDSLFVMVRQSESKLPNELWGEAMSAANHLQNKIVP